MERFHLKVIFTLLYCFALPLCVCALSLEEAYEQIESLGVRTESGGEETKLLKTLSLFFKENEIRVNRLAYAPSSLVQSFSNGLYVRVPGSSHEGSVFFIFPLDQREGSPSTANNAGIYMALEAILNAKTKKIPPQRTMYFVFLGGELTRETPIGSLFLLQNSAINFKNALFYYFEVSNLSKWQIYTRGKKPYHATPKEDLTNFLETLRLIPSISFEVMDSFPIKNIFKEHNKEPFDTYNTLNFPFLQIKTNTEENSLANLEKQLDRVIWLDFFSKLAATSIENSSFRTNQYYLYFQFWQWFILIDSSYYLIFVLLFANFITFTSVHQIRFVSDRVSQTLKFSWYFLFLFFLFFLSLLLSSRLFPLLVIPYDPHEVSSGLLYIKIAFASFLSFSLLYLAHPTLGNLPKQTYLYMTLFTFLLLAGLVTFYNILSSFFFLVSGILVFLGIITSGFVRHFLNFITFLWLFYILQEGIDHTWLKFFLGTGTNTNLLLEAILFPYLLLILSYTTPNQKILSRQFSRSLFNKMQTTLVLSFSFAVIFIWLEQKREKFIPSVQITEEWKVGEPSINLSFQTNSKKELELSHSQIEVIRQSWLREEPEQAPKVLNKNHLSAEIIWLKANLFKRQDYQVSITFPFCVETLETTLTNSNPTLPPIVYRSELPYEITEKGNIRFATGPNPPQNFTFDLSLDTEEGLMLNLIFSSPKIEKKETILINGELYHLFWRQRVRQNAGSSGLETKDNPLEVILENEPEIKRLKQLSLPKQRLFP